PRPTLSSKPAALRTAHCLLPQNMAREISLDGAEITIIKALGIGAGEVSGETLLSKIPNQRSTDLASILKDLIMVGYVDADKNSFYSDEEFKKTNFHI